MYNRYIPQQDGSFRRNRIDEPRQRPPQQKPREHPQRQPECRKEPEQPHCPPPQEPEPRHRCEHRHERHESVTGFLQNLLPKDFDTGDLIVILLLLLLAGDCEEDRGNALLTLALYLFM